MKQDNVKNITKRRWVKTHGFTAIEAIGVLIVGLIAIAYGASHWNDLFGKNNQGEELTIIGKLVANTKALKSSGGYGASGSNLVTSLSNANGLNGLTVVSGIPYNSWNGSVAVVSTGSGFTVTYNGVPTADCMSLVTNLSKGGAFVSTQVNSSSIVTGAYSAQQASTDCGSASTNSITWTSLN